MGSDSLKTLARKISSRRMPKAEASGARQKAECQALTAMGCIQRPTGVGLDNLLEVAGGGKIAKRAFDGLLVPAGVEIDFTDKASIRAHLRDLVFVDVKTTNRHDLDNNFRGFYFSVSKNELNAAKALGERYRFALYNLHTGSILELTLPQLRARVRNWQVSHSVQI